MDISLKRSFDPDFINSVLNDPSVRDQSEIKGLGDVTDIVSDVNNVLLTNEFGGFIYIKKQLGVYEVHTQFLEAGRGVKALKAAIDSVRYMFIHTDCMRILSNARPENTGACQLAERVLGQKGFNGTYNYYSLEYMEWVETDRIVKKRGEFFHTLVEESTNHDEDDIHDYHVGAAIMLCEAGNALKAQQVYNYWAIASGYELVNIDSFNPLIVSVGNMRLTFPLEVI